MQQNNLHLDFGIVETVNRRIDKLPAFGLIIIDEAHIGNFNKLPFFNDENVKIVGVSATPFSNTPNMSCHKPKNPPL